MSRGKRGGSRFSGSCGRFGSSGGGVFSGSQRFDFFWVLKLEFRLFQRHLMIFEIERLFLQFQVRDGVKRPHQLDEFLAARTLQESGENDALGFDADLTGERFLVPLELYLK